MGHHGSAKPHYYFYKGHIRFHGKPHLLGKKKKKTVAKPTSLGKLSKHAAKKKLSTLTSAKVQQDKVKLMAAKKNLKGVMDKVKREKGNLNKNKNKNKNKNTNKNKTKNTNKNKTKNTNKNK